MTEEPFGGKNKRRKPRTLEIEMLRLWCTIAVCLHHLRYCSEALPYGGGYIAVDFFFMVSGFYLRQSYVHKKNAIGVFKFIKKRYIRLYKDYVIAFIIAFFINLFIFKINISGSIFGYISEAFMLEIGNLESGLRINPPDWYCGYLLFASAVIYVFQKNIKRWIGSFSLFLGTILYFLLAISQRHLCIFPLREGVNEMAVLRAMAGLLIGIFIFELYKKNELIEVPNVVLKTVFFGGIIWISYMIFWDTAFSVTDYIVLPVFAILIYICQFIEISCLMKINNTIWEVFSQLGYIAFLNHYVVVKMINYYNLFNYLDWKVVSLLYIFIIFVFSYLLLRIRELLEWTMKRCCMKHEIIDKI